MHWGDTNVQSIGLGFPCELRFVRPARHVSSYFRSWSLVTSHPLSFNRRSPVMPCFSALLSLCRSQAASPAWLLSPHGRGGLGPRGWLPGGGERPWRAFALCATTHPSLSCPGTPGGPRGPALNVISDQSLGFQLQFQLFFCPLLNKPALGVGFVQ